MHITLNGDAREFPLDTTVVELLDTLGYAGKRVAVERNGEIVPKSQHAQTTLADGDQIEIVVAVGGAECPPPGGSSASPEGLRQRGPLLLRPRRRGLGVMICRKRRQSMSRTGLSATRPGVIIRSEHVSRQVGREPGSPPWKFPAWCRGWSGNATTRLIREPRSVSRNPFPPCRPAAVQRAIRQPRHARRARHLAHPGAPYVDTQIETGIQPFTAQMSGTHLGASLISRSTCSATVQHRRTALDVRRSQVDHLLIQLFVAGGTRATMAKPGRYPRRLDRPA